MRKLKSTHKSPLIFESNSLSIAVAALWTTMQHHNLTIS